jgi:hypothetical protein
MVEPSSVSLSGSSGRLGGASGNARSNEAIGAARCHGGEIAACSGKLQPSDCRDRGEVGFGFCELRTMSRPASEYPDDVTVYLVVNDFGSLGRALSRPILPRPIGRR